MPSGTVSAYRLGMRTKNPSKVETVRALTEFSRCSQKELIDLTSQADEIDFLPGSVLIREGTPAEEAFLILSGRVSVRLCGAIISTAGAGETVGEMALIDRAPRSATVVAETPVRALVFGRRQFGGLIDQPGPARAVSAILARRLRVANSERVGPLTPVA